MLEEGNPRYKRPVPSVLAQANEIGSPDLARALEKHFARPDVAAQYRDFLARIDNAQRITSSPAYIIRSFAEEHKAQLIIGGAIFITGLAGIIYATSK